MIDLIIGIAIGAAFAPFWMKVFALVKAGYQKFMTN